MDAATVERITDFAGDNEVELALEAEDDVGAYTGVSDYDSVYAWIARRSNRRARMLDENPQIAKILKKVIIGIERFCHVHNCRPEDLDVEGKLTVEGRVVVTPRIRKHRW